MCSDAVDVVIEKMTAQGKRADVIGLTVGLTKFNVVQRQRKLRSCSASVNPIKAKRAPRVVVIGKAEPKPRPVKQKAEPKLRVLKQKLILEPRPAKQKPGPKPRPICPWPSGNPAREMHICCRVRETGDVRCDDAA